MIKSLLYFVAAGLCEIGGGYLIWLWLRENRPIWFALVGGAILILYGVIPTLQPANFGRVYGFALEIEREGGSLWLSLTGRDGVKPFIMAEVGEHFSNGP